MKWDNGMLYIHNCLIQFLSVQTGFDVKIKNSHAYENIYKEKDGNEKCIDCTAWWQRLYNVKFLLLPDIIDTTCTRCDHIYSIIKV